VGTVFRIEDLDRKLNPIESYGWGLDAEGVDGIKLRPLAQGVDKGFGGCQSNDKIDARAEPRIRQAEAPRMA